MADFRNWESHLWKWEAFSRDSCVYTIEFLYSHKHFFFFFGASIMSCARDRRIRMKRLNSSLAVSHGLLSRVPLLW